MDRLRDNRDAGEFLKALLKLLPSGNWWEENSQPGGDIQNTLEAKAQELARLDERAVQLVLEAFPQYAVETLDKYEEDLGLSGEGLTKEQRRAEIVSTLLGRRSQKASLEALCASYGYRLLETIRQGAFGCLNSRMMERLWMVENRVLITFRVGVPRGTVTPDRVFEAAIRAILIAYYTPEYIYEEISL